MDEAERFESGSCQLGAHRPRMSTAVAAAQQWVCLYIVTLTDTFLACLRINFGRTLATSFAMGHKVENA
jgi:hypothetical protein